MTQDNKSPIATSTPGEKPSTSGTEPHKGPTPENDPNAPTEQSERAAEEQDDGAVPSKSY